MMSLPCKHMRSSQPQIFTYHSCSWMLYDWASSLLPTLHTTFVFAVYFTTVIMPDTGTFYWAMMTGSVALITGLLAPILGHLADVKGHLKGALILTSIAAASAVMALWFIAPDAHFAVLALGLSGLAIFFSELGFMYYNALLPRLASPQVLGRISGYGWGLGYIGAILGLVIVLAIFILPSPPLFGLSEKTAEPVRATMVFAGAWLILFSLPLFLMTPRSAATPNRQPFLASLHQSWKLVLSLPDMVRFLIARMAYNDGLVTLFAFGGIYAAKVFGFTQQDILIFAIALNITAGIGAIIGGPLTDRWGPPWNYSRLPGWLIYPWPYLSGYPRYLCLLGGELVSGIFHWPLPGCRTGMGCPSCPTRTSCQPVWTSGTFRQTDQLCRATFIWLDCVYHRAGARRYGGGFGAVYAGLFSVAKAPAGRLGKRR